MKPVVVELIGLVLMTFGAHTVEAHSRLVEPPPRSQTISTTAPCGAGAAVGAPVREYAVGEMVQVTFTEVQTHGTFRVALSHDNVSFGTVLLDNIAVQTSGASRMVTVQMPATTCDACVLQLFQRNGNGGYYSCADIRVMAAATTTTATTTTLPFDGSSTTTTTTVPPSDPCADQVDYDAADCRIGTALADLPCAGDVMDPTLDTAVRAGLRKVQALLGMARSKTKPTQANHILKKADHKLAALTKRAARTAAHGRTSATCASNVDALIAEIRDAIAALAAGA